MKMTGIPTHPSCAAPVMKLITRAREQVLSKSQEIIGCECLWLEINEAERDRTDLPQASHRCRRRQSCSKATQQQRPAKTAQRLNERDCCIPTHFIFNEDSNEMTPFLLVDGSHASNHAGHCPSLWWALPVFFTDLPGFLGRRHRDSTVFCGLQKEKYNTMAFGLLDFVETRGGKGEETADVLYI